MSTLHDAAEHHRNDGHGHGVHHVHNAALFQQLNHGVIGILSQRTLENRTHLITECIAIHTKGEQGTQVTGVGLENQTQNSTRKDPYGNGGHLHGHRHDDDNGGQKQDGVDVEHAALRGVQRSGKLSHSAHISLAAVILHGAKHAEHNQGNRISDNSGNHHRLDVCNDVGTSHGGGQIGGVGQGRHLIAEVRAGQDGAGGHSRVHIQAEADAHQGHAHGAHGAPGGTGGQGSDGTNQNGGDEEDGGMHDLQSVVDHGGNDAGIDPHTDQNAHDDQNTDGLEGLINAVHHHLLNAVPLVAQIQGHQGRHTDAHKHGHMDRRSKNHDADCQYPNQRCQGNAGLPYLRHSGFSIGFIRLTHGFLPTFLSLLCNNCVSDSALDSRFLP